MYVQSASANLTPQGKAIRESSVIFSGKGGDGSIGFPTCKYKYQPVKDGIHFVACWQHEKFRRERVEREKGFRDYEVNVAEVFWNKEEDEDNKKDNKKVKKEKVKEEE
ncbi:hypothetical protein TrST_g8846 [Triparma strigata]|uniref:Uncharacterized protein n=2 Tax=Triparma TaxID=722752 RepID=A0A9W7A5V4_9STRA|nr:hypothetical protein TrST_g8846 [Triparma strigata]